MTRDTMVSFCTDRVPAGEPAAPAGLTASQLVVWREVVEALRPLDVIASVDGHYLEVIARNVDAMRRADAVLSEQGEVFETATGYLAPRPEVAIARAARAQLGKLLKDIGAGGLLSRMALPSKPQTTAFETFLNKGTERT